MKLRRIEPERIKVRYVPFSEATERKPHRFVPIQPKRVRPSEPPAPRSRLGWVTAAMYSVVAVVAAPVLLVRASSNVAPPAARPAEVAAAQTGVESTPHVAAPAPVVTATAEATSSPVRVRARSRIVARVEPEAEGVRQGLTHIDGPPPNPFD